MTGFLIREARLVPLEEGVAPGEPVDVLVRDGVVTRVGRDLPRPDALPVHHAGGRWLLPGLWDQHVHLGQWVLASHRLDLTGARSLGAALALVAERLHAWPDVPVVGWGHRPASWDERPTVAALDDLAGMRPVVLISGDGHHAWLNSVAMRGLGLPEREGMVSEAEWFAVYPRLAQLVGSDGSSPDAYLAVQQQAAARGVVGVVDLEFDQSVSAWPERSSMGAELLRVRVGAYVDTLDEFIDAGLRTGQRLPGCGPRITMGPLKVISDGSLNTCTAWCCSPYADGSTGAPNISAQGLRWVMEAANRHGLEVAIHAIGDAAASQALDAYEATGARGSIEHAQLILREDAARMAALGVRASVQPAHLWDDRDLTAKLWPDRTERCFALRWLLDAGVELAMGSDAPVATLDPWLAAAAAVHRSADEREPWHPEQALTVREALAASTDGAGTVAPGHLADLALLDQDPLVTGSSADQSAALRDLTVAATWVDGELVHDTL
ncbi:amidohydrolase [Nocardioides aequoreus]|uniref:amidohydrolase n=1 Tax=Nocardioides aequoreus TaxID=397278 RepID=UPI0004C3DFFD|nr:amidohydrolase family protein [Nocardioides aequoreus]